MYLTMHNQLTLLHDLLDEQLVYKTVTDEEYKRIKAIIRSLTADKHEETELTNLLPEIYYFCIKGENAHSTLDHICDNEANIKKWLDMINQMKKESVI